MHNTQTGTADVNGARQFYEVVGKGKSLVLVHAGIADGRMWDPQVGPFAERYRVVRYDMRGFGGSPAVAGAYSHHEDLRVLLDALCVEEAVLVGCSMGAKTVLDFALAYPERARALVLVGPAV